MEQHDWHCQTYAAWIFEVWNKPEYWHDNDNSEEGMMDDQIDY